MSFAFAFAQYLTLSQKGLSMRILANQIKDHLNLIPLILFQGSKGFLL